MSASEEEFLRMLRATFRAEADEYVQTMAAALLTLERGGSPEECRASVGEIFRAAHSLKGAARAVNLLGVETICQGLEDQFARWKRQEEAPAREDLDRAHEALDQVAAILAESSSDEGASVAPTLPPPPGPAFEIAPPTPPLHATVAPAPPPEPPSPAPAAEATAPEKALGVETVRIPVAKLDARLLEAEELLIAKLMGEQRTVEFRELTRRFDDWSKSWGAVEPAVRAWRRAQDRDGKAAAVPPQAERLLDFLEWNCDYIRALETKVATLGRAAVQEQATVGKLVDDLLEDSKHLLMLPLSTLGAYFPKLVRDLCRDQGKEAELVIQGAEIEVDKRILQELKDPLVHILRNCVDHGLEIPEERQRRGKSPRALITLAVVSVPGSKVEIVVSDDGAGIDPAKVRTAALKHGTISEAEAARLTEQELIELIFRPDLSTSPIITQISGRGLGLAIVREKTELLGGRVAVESRLGFGTTFRITLPVALSTFRGILVQAGERPFILPTASVEKAVRFLPSDVQTVEARETLSLDGRAVALVRLTDVLGIPAAPMTSAPVGKIPGIILGAGNERLVFAVDAILEEQEVLVKRLPKPLLRVRNVAGATVLGSGRIATILHVADLLKSARKAGRKAAPTTAPTPRLAAEKSILVAEDSITSRMLLKGILESAGYRVKVAVDGMAAFTALRSEHFDLVVSDVEMPRMNGFQLTARIRDDKKLAELPVILLTALASREDQERGIEVGADAYLVKSSFDQSNLLEAVRRLA